MSPEVPGVPASDGWRLKVAYLPPPPRGPVHGALWAGHAMMANRKSLDRPEGEGLGTTLARCGFHVYLADMRGHGESGPRAEEGGRWSYDDIVLKDIPAITRFVKNRHPELPLAVVGHSLVGHGTLAALGQMEGLPIDAVVSIASNTWVRAFEPSRLQWMKKRAVLSLFTGLARRKGYFPAKDYKFGSDNEARRYVEQFGRWARSGRWTSEDGSRDYLAGLARVACPVLSIAGAGDRFMCPPEEARRFHARLTRAPVTEWIVSKDSRFGYDATHMSLVTSRRGKVLWEAMATWLADTLGAVAAKKGPGKEKPGAEARP